MSTRLTPGGVSMVDSQALKLVLGAGKVSDLISHYLANCLKSLGYQFASPSVLNFLSTLECGVNYGSDIARNLGVSRQMVAKTVKELCAVGYLDQVDDIGKQKKIIFTSTGEHLMSDARRLLANMDETLTTQLGEKRLANTISSLTEIQNLVESLIIK